MSGGWIFVLTFIGACEYTSSARIKQRRFDSSVSGPEPAALWEEYVGFADLSELLRSVKEKKLAAKVANLGVSGMESMLTQLEEAHGDHAHFNAFKAIVEKTIRRVKAAEEKQAAKEAASRGATYLEKNKQRQHQTAKWQKIITGKERCKTGVTVKFVKAGTLGEALALGDVNSYSKGDTVLAFDMDGTLVDMRDYYPKEMMESLGVYDAADKVVITAADNRLGCDAVTTSLLAALPHSNMPATNGTQCDDLVQGSAYDLESASCQCPANFFVNGLSDLCRDKETLHRSSAIPPAELAIEDTNESAKCYCEPDLFEVFGIDAAAECPEMSDAKGDFMIAKSGVIMNRYAKAEGLTAYYKDPTLSRGRQFKQVVFFDDWVENPVNFAEFLCFTEAPPGLEHVVSVWYATDRMEAREREKMARLRAGKMAADNSEGNYYHPMAWNDARLAGMRAVFGVGDLA